MRAEGTELLAECVTLILVKHPRSLVESARATSKALLIALCVMIGFDFFIGIGNGLLGPIDEHTAITPGILVLALIQIAQFPALIVTAIFYFIWLARSINAVNAMSVRPFPFSPAMAIVYHFIPLIGIVRPFQAVSQLFEWSTPSGERVTSKIKMTMWGWWLSWLLSGVLAYADAMSPQPGVMVFSSLLSILAAGCLIVLSGELPQIQIRRVAEWEAEQERQAAEGFAEYPRPADPTIV